jgi:hypothetical protein
MGHRAALIARIERAPCRRVRHTPPIAVARDLGGTEPEEGVLAFNSCEAIVMKRLTMSAAAAYAVSAFLWAIPLLPAQAVQAANARLFCAARRFDVDILRGPDRDLSLVGQLAFKQSAPRRLSGTLNNHGHVLRVSGSVNGRRLRLVFHLRSGLTMSGTGLSTSTITTCAQVPRTGRASGPRPGDTGRWGYGIGG